MASPLQSAVEQAEAAIAPQYAARARSMAKEQAQHIKNICIGSSVQKRCAKALAAGLISLDEMDAYIEGEDGPGAILLDDESAGEDECSSDSAPESDCETGDIKDRFLNLLSARLQLLVLGKMLLSVATERQRKRELEAAAQALGVVALSLGDPVLRAARAASILGHQTLYHEVSTIDRADTMARHVSTMPSGLRSCPTNAPAHLLTPSRRRVWPSHSTVWHSLRVCPKPPRRATVYDAGRCRTRQGWPVRAGVLQRVGTVRAAAPRRCARACDT